jgi:hypothetical protein
MKSSGLFAERETFSKARILSPRSRFNSACASFIPTFFNPTELPKQPVWVSQITGSGFPGFGTTWKLSS